MKNQTKSNWRAIVFAAIAMIFIFGAFSSTFAQKGVGAKYGARDPRTCDDMKAPAKGAITAALAAKYFICASEKEDYRYLYLVENVKTEVGGGIPYAAIRGQRIFNEIDVSVPVYPIRGSHTEYQCNRESDYYQLGKNCTRYEHKQAKGYCYKTTFGDWNCHQSELSMPNENIFYDVPPPKGDNAVAAKVENNKPAGTKNVNQPEQTKTAKQTTETKDEPTAGKDENGFVKPDFSEMQEYFEIIRYEYDFKTRDLYIIGKLKKKNNLNKWQIEFLDADGARIKSGNTVEHYTSVNAEVGQVVKMYAGTPTEKQMRDEVKKIVVTRILE